MFCISRLLTALLVLCTALPISAAAETRNVVFIAGKKSHGPGDHEYEKSLRLLMRSLKSSPQGREMHCTLHIDGWPKDPAVLNTADTVVLFSDGSDHNEADHPLLNSDRLDQLRRAVARGCGLVVVHYSVFVPTARGGREFLDWIGGYFDYESGAGTPKWFSKIRHAETVPTPVGGPHPVCRGLKPFPLREEYYYNIRFKPDDPRLTPILNTQIPGEPAPQTVAWAVTRSDGGRGFGFTGGHFYDNWRLPMFRKMLLNAVVWTAKGEVPANGVDGPLHPDDDIVHTLIVTGRHHPAHDWKATTAAVTDALRRDPRMVVRVTENPETMATENLAKYDLLLLNYCNWESSTLSEPARAKLLAYVRSGGGLLPLHFANGAWGDWEEYRKLSRRVWKEPTSTHDPYGPFRVKVVRKDHPVTRVLSDFDTVDELYARQSGDLPVEPLLTAKSRVTGMEEPLAYAYTEGKGRIFQCLLGHDAGAIRNPSVSTLLRRAAAWTANRIPTDIMEPVETASRVVPGRSGTALNAALGGVTVASRPEYNAAPLTVDCWAKLHSSGSFNILIASQPKGSGLHWELYTMAGSGTLSAYIPSAEPQVIDTGVPVCDRSWHHLALAFEHNRVRMWVDGRAAADRPVRFSPGETVNGPLWIGAYPPQGIGCDGLIDEVRIAAGADIPAQGAGRLLGAWSFDTNDGRTFPDASPLRNPAVDETGIPASPAARAPWPRVDRKAGTDWQNVGNDKGGTRYSPLSQINAQNVRQLKQAWVYRSGDFDNGTTIECTPIVIDGVMYVTTPKMHIVALDASSGREIWRYNAKSFGVNRGVAYWSDGKTNGARRILMGTEDGRLLSLDAVTGVPDPAFGENGSVDLRKGLDRDIGQMFYGVSSAPAVFEDLVILGFHVSEGQPGAPGDIRAFDVRTGRERWRFHTVPRPGEPGNETWEPGSWKDRSGTNPWSGFTIDVKRGMLFCGTGSAASDFYGGDRKGKNLYANCTLALNARTGKLLWHFQTVHHDVWDHDNPCPPVLVTINRGGRKIDAVAQPTKTGYVFVLDRLTGKPLYDVKEVPTVPSTLKGEEVWPTQPVPVKPPAIARLGFTLEEVTNISPEARREILERIEKEKLRYGSPYTPPSLEGSIIFPGFHGGATWSGSTFDPTTGYLYLNTNNVPWLAKLRENPSGGYDFTGYNRFLDSKGFPAVKPPWGLLTAIDLSKGEFVWQKTFGMEPELAKRGITDTGCENFGGGIVTAGDLFFIASTKDATFRAYHKRTGEILFEAPLPAAGYACPATYRVNGKQYVVIACGGGGKLGTKTGDYFVAFALP
jgi:quinoprotein glucose dehydrogenase